MKEHELIKAALAARENAYAPYSNYLVGAAVETADGRLFTGCNIENASYGATNCAERTAIFKAVSEGARELTAIAIAGGNRGGAPDYAFPCGICRQVMREFGNPEKMLVIVAKDENDYRSYLLKELLPESFGPDNLKKERK